MLNKDFYPTPLQVIEQMISGMDLIGTNVLEPSAGSGNIVDVLNNNGCNVTACEIESKLRKILNGKCKLLKNDFLDVTKEEVSHIHYIVMNPPFSKDEEHILHAWEIAPDGCEIAALCNSETLNNPRNRYRKHLKSIVNDYGLSIHLGECFKQSERSTDVSVSLIRLYKPKARSENEFDGYFDLFDDDFSEGSGIMQHNEVREIVNRYTGAVKLYDKVLETGVEMNSLIGGMFGSKLTFIIKQGEVETNRAEFKKELQKQAWKYVFQKMRMGKYMTAKLQADINKFCEQQVNIPFSMRNIFKMMQLVVGTHGQRMDKALIEVFEKLTYHYKENRYNVEGWVTNSHYMINKKFIYPNFVKWGWSGRLDLNYHSMSNNPIDDFMKAVCYLKGDNYDNYKTLWAYLSENKCQPGTWYDWGYFRFKGFKKGTMHIQFKEEKDWELVNKRIAEINGFTLMEKV